MRHEHLLLRGRNCITTVFLINVNEAKITRREQYGVAQLKRNLAKRLLTTMCLILS